MIEARPAVSRLEAHRVTICVVAAIVVPIVVGIVFPHPTTRVVVPESVMLATTVVLTLIGGKLAGLVATSSATMSLWFFSFPPGLSFRAASWGDIVAVFVAGAITGALVLLVSTITLRQRAETERGIALTSQVRSQRETIATMQHALLPDTIAPTDGLGLGWHYVAGGTGPTPVGGDWFAFVPISAHLLGVAIGDVAGHGLPAVSSMAAYHFALRTLAIDGASPPDVVQRLETVTSLYGNEYFSSCVYGLFDVHACRWTYTSAGHPPPILIRDGKFTVLKAPHGPVVGSGLPTRPYVSTTVELNDDDLIALYTDGLIERRDESLTVGIERLASRLAKHQSHENLFDLSADIVAELTGADPQDDVALVLMRYEPHQPNAA